MTDKLKSEIENCTVYVENFPSGFSDQEVALIFKNYKVRDVRVPKHGKQGNQGFAFVELDTPESVVKAISDLQNALPAEFGFDSNSNEV